MAETGPNVAIACQGGGSHTAFTAGALERLVPAIARSDASLVGLSGTSGGAMNAVVAWSALLEEGPGAVPDALAAFWADLAARGPLDRIGNGALVGGMRAASAGLPLVEASPAQVPGTRLAQRRLRETIEAHVAFDRLPALVGPDCPRLVVGTVDVNGGCFEAFVDEAITPDVLLASAAVPELFPAVEMNGHYHWDGLFSQNPPVHELFAVDAARKPDELWVLQINPQESDGEPTSPSEIADRRNELAGNISLNQELRFVERVNDWVASGALADDAYSHTEIRRAELDGGYDYASKLDRSPAFIEALMERGRAAAGDLLAAGPVDVPDPVPPADGAGDSA